MKLVCCHIENFGKLADLDIDFSEQLHTIKKENGWGKSTLATFLKVMFYGFGNERKRSTQKERKKYQPWQGGGYGGSLIFETQGEIYRIERTFGEREREDTFFLYDERTGLQSEKFSKDIGKELFLLDEISFYKTMYISSGECFTEATDSIHAKIGNISEQMYDLKEYTNAEQILGKELNRLSDKRKTGLLAKLREEKERLQGEVLQGEELMRRLAFCEEQIQALEKEREQYLWQQEKIQKDILGREQRAVAKVQLEQYKELCKNQEEIEKKVENLEDFFLTGVPEKEETKEALETVKEEELVRMGLGQISYTEEEERVYKQIQNWGKCPEIEDLELCTEMFEKIREQVQYVSKQEDDRKKIPPVSMLVGGGIAILGVILCMWSLLLGLCILIAGIVYGIFGLKQKGEREEVVEFNENGNDVERLEWEINHYLEQFPLEREFGLQEHLQQLQLVNVQNRSIQERKEKQKKLELRLEELEEISLSYFEKYNFPMQLSKVLYLQEIWEKLLEYEKAVEDLNGVMQKKNELAQHCGIDPSAVMEDILQPVEDLQNELSSLMEIGNQKQKQIYERFTEKESIEKQLEQLRQCSEKMQEISGRIKEAEKQYFLVEKAQLYLKQAKEQFTAKYRNPIAEGVDKYLLILLGEVLDVSVDSHFHIKKKEKGLLRDFELLSSGWQDVVAICLRLAMIDAMYQKEKPFLIFDDPFLNLDDEKLEGAFELLKKVSGEYQIIYFTCHDSRAME